jgi:hypothetical protein
MAQTVTQSLLSQQAFTNTPSVATGIGSISGDVLTLTSVTSSVGFSIGVGIRGVDSLGNQIPAGTVITGVGPTVPNAQTYYINTTASILQTTITTILGVCTSYNVTGTKVAAASYYLGNKALQTVNINTTGFTGTLLIEASLYTDPSTSTAEPSDWFTVHSIVADVNATSGSTEALAAATNTAVNITGNYVWMRARIVDFASGTVNWVKLSY